MILCQPLCYFLEQISVLIAVTSSSFIPHNITPSHLFVCTHVMILIQQRSPSKAMLQRLMFLCLACSELSVELVTNLEPSQTQVNQSIPSIN
jgi:hypothetical protein